MRSLPETLSEVCNFAQTSSYEDARQLSRKANGTQKAVASLERRVLTSHDKCARFEGNGYD